MAKKDTPPKGIDGAFDEPAQEERKNNSAGKPYYTQRNNKIKPGTACNVTSMISALSAAGWPVEKLVRDGEQPEDALMRFLLTDPVCASEWRRCDPSGQYPPNEWHAILALGTNRFLCRRLGSEWPAENYRAVVFTEGADSLVIAELIQEGGAAVCSGLFTLPDGRKMNHMVSMVGFVGDEEPSAFILDDPWGDYRTGYTSQKGNDVEMSMEDFLSIIKTPGSPRKLAHLVRRYA
jgi:hypothetical protein